MLNPLPTILFVVLAVIGYFVLGPNANAPTSIGEYAAWLFASGVISSMFRIAAQWEKALVFRLGRFQSVKGPGVFTVMPLLDQVRIVDTRIFTVDIPSQQAITKDNVPVTTDAVIFLRVSQPEDAVIQVQNYVHAIRQYAQTALRDVIGSVTLDEILADRESVGKRIEEMVDSEIQGWGLDVAAIRIQDIILPEDLKRVMARQAAAEREKRANITKSEGDRMAAENLAAAAKMMATAPGALQLRTLQTLDSLGSSQANTVVMAVPVEVMGAIQAIGGMMPSKVPVSVPEAEKAPAVTPLALGESFKLAGQTGKKEEETEKPQQQTQG
jgi:regulator of protease activity HflC (stomatin/prohibitin superfamily)